MQNRSKILVLSAFAMALAACTGMQEKAAYSSPQVINSHGTRVDEAYVAYVEDQARRHGVEVRWVNLPTKPVTRVATTE